MNFATLTPGDNTLECTDNGAEGELKRALMAVGNQTEQRPKPLTKNEELGLCWRILSYALHSGEQSTRPPNYSSSQWVELYSLHCTVGFKLLLIIHTTITMTIYIIQSQYISFQ